MEKLLLLFCLCLKRSNGQDGESPRMSVYQALDDLRVAGTGSVQTIRQAMLGAVAGTTYPTLARIPQTSFSCDQVGYAGYYADPETGCQVYRQCLPDNAMYSYLCANQTLFNQVSLVCDWWYNVNCAKASFYYTFSNPRLYQEHVNFLDDNGPGDSQVIGTTITTAPTTTTTQAPSLLFQLPTARRVVLVTPIPTIAPLRAPTTRAPTRAVVRSLTTDRSGSRPPLSQNQQEEYDLFGRFDRLRRLNQGAAQFKIPKQDDSADKATLSELPTKSLAEDQNHPMPNLSEQSNRFELPPGNLSLLSSNTAVLVPFESVKRGSTAAPLSTYRASNITTAVLFGISGTVAPLLPQTMAGTTTKKQQELHNVSSTSQSIFVSSTLAPAHIMTSSVHIMPNLSLSTTTPESLPKTNSATIASFPSIVHSEPVTAPIKSRSPQTRSLSLVLNIQTSNRPDDVMPTLVPKSSKRAG